MAKFGENVEELSTVEKFARLVEFQKQKARGTELFDGADAKRGKRGKVKERRKKDKRRVERTMAWNGVDRKMPRFHPSVRPCTFRFINSSIPASRFSPPFHPLFFFFFFSTLKVSRNRHQPSRMSGIYYYFKSRSSCSFFPPR